MDNLLLSAILGIIFILFVLFLVLKNKKDKKDLEETIKQNYPRPRHHSDDVENAEREI